MNQSCAHSGQNERSPSTPSDQNDQWVTAASSALTLWSHAVHRTAVGSGGARSRLRFWAKIDVIPLACSIASRLANGARGRRAAMPVSRKFVDRSACSGPTGCLSPFGTPGSVAFKSLSSGVDDGMSLRCSDLAGRRRWPVQGSVARRLSESPHAKAAQHLGCQVQQRVFDMRRRSNAPAGGVDVEVRGKARPGFDTHRGVARMGLAGSGPVLP